MSQFIAYFDYLGFKEFIENNDLSYQKKIMGNNFRDIENALGQGKFKPASAGVVADLSRSTINCMNFSDTVVFWTNDDSDESLKAIIDVSHKFNWQATLFFFPARGAVVYGEIVHVDYKETSGAGGSYNLNSLYGKGLVRAYQKAESQNWSGTVLDASFIDELIRRGLDPEDYLKPYAKRFKIPYKNAPILPEEFAYCLITGDLNDEAFANYSQGIRENFANHNKSVDSSSVQEKLENTIGFLASFK